MKKFLGKLRKLGVPIIHTRNSDDPTLQPDNMRKKQYDSFGNTWSAAIPGTWGHEFALDVPKEELVFDKYSFSILSNQSLKQHLEKIGVKTLIIFGVTTHLCVETSVRTAFTEGYHIILATDLVGAADQLRKEHEHTLNILATFFAYGLTADEIASLLQEEFEPCSAKEVKNEN